MKKTIILVSENDQHANSIRTLFAKEDHKIVIIPCGQALDGQFERTWNSVYIYYSPEKEFEVDLVRHLRNHYSAHQAAGTGFKSKSVLAASREDLLTPKTKQNTDLSDLRERIARYRRNLQKKIFT